MKKRGFTLVEMLGVMTILAVIFALLYPNIMHMLDKSKAEDYEEYRSNIQLAAEAYVTSNNLDSNLVNVGDKVSVTYSDLLNSGFLSSKIVNPKTGVGVGDEPNVKVTITLTSNNTYEYTIEEG